MLSPGDSEPSCSEWLGCSMQGCGCSTQKMPRGGQAALSPGPCDSFWKQSPLIRSIPFSIKKQICKWNRRVSGVCVSRHIHIYTYTYNYAFIHRSLLAKKTWETPNSTYPITSKYFSHVACSLFWSSNWSFSQGAQNKGKVSPLEAHSCIYTWTESGISQKFRSFRRLGQKRY